jgi:hypothetical protein
MKIKKQDLDALRKAIGPRIHGATTMRQRWDALNAANDAHLRSTGRGITVLLHDYLDDSHIDTALRVLAAE